MRFLLTVLTIFFATSFKSVAEADTIQNVLQEHSQLILKSSRKTIAPAIDAISESNLPQAQEVLRAWQNKSIWLRKTDGLFFRAQKVDSKTYELFNFENDKSIGTYPKSELKQIKPNSGIRNLIASALVRFQLSDPDPNVRLVALKAIERQPTQDALTALRTSTRDEKDIKIKEIKERLERLLTISFDPNQNAKLEAIKQVSGDLDISVRATLNRLLAKSVEVFTKDLPDDLNIARRLDNNELEMNEAYDRLAENGLVKARLKNKDIKEIIINNVDTLKRDKIRISDLNTPEARQFAFDILVEKGVVDPNPTEEEISQTVGQYQFIEVYKERSSDLTSAAVLALNKISKKVAYNQMLDLSLDAISLASIYFLAAIGLAITFGVMGVINMAHGEFIMMGAYTGFVVQQFVTNQTASIIIAIPLAFFVTFLAGVLMERLVIQWLYKRPLETLLATFGISIALQQLAKNIFGTQARPLTSPDWLDGALVLNDVVSISYIRIAIFVLAILFLLIFLFIINHTRFGLETRAVTQNSTMAASMGINTNKINMLTFGLGSGIAGVAGVAIGLFAKVTSELGSDYIVQSFMTVVVGGVGNIWGTLAGAALIGILQKFIEWFNPSNTLAAQTYMIIFIILFIQFRPRGIIALKGRAAGD
ncbi:MAG: urea ABC transporter permease subunit UrtB [Paracoccaceae bacterium]